MAGRLRRDGGSRTVGAGLLLALVIVTLASLRPEIPDGFYRPPDNLGEAAPGALLRAERLRAGLPTDVAGWRVLYRSTDHNGDPVAVSGLVLRPRGGDGQPAPLVSLVHGTVGVDQACAPSLAERPLGMLPGAAQALAAGFVVAATDLPGLGTPGPHPYLLGLDAGQAALDIARAAPELAAVDPARLAVWGFSQGGHAALFAGELAARYAPELGLRGVVAFAPATDLEALVRTSQGSLLGTLLSVQAAVAWSELDERLELEDIVEPASIPLARDLATRCLNATSLPLSTWTSLRLRDEVADLSTPQAAAWTERLRANTPTGPVAAPVLILQGDADFVVDPNLTAEHVRQRCTTGESVELRLVPAAEHFTVVWRSADEAAAWTAARFAGLPADSSC